VRLIVLWILRKLLLAKDSVVEKMPKVPFSL